MFIIMGSILITQAQRRIPVQQAKHTRGRRVYGGGKQFLPLRVNHGGVMPIIFAQSLMLFPGALFGWLDTSVFKGNNSFVGFLNGEFKRGSYIYILTELAMIYFFAYFWTTVQFQPKEMANQLRDYGSFIPGLRPGKRTADYLEKVMMRITYVGAAFLVHHRGDSNGDYRLAGDRSYNYSVPGRDGFADCGERGAGYGSAD